jgi:hypothetical protein
MELSGLQENIVMPINEPSVPPLLQYYECEVAGLMPWFDDDHNPWRTVMLPLAQKCESLLHAILALAAEHQGHSKSYPLNPKSQELVSYHRSKSLRLLAQRLHVELTQDEVSPQQTTDPSGLLATILVLCNVEMIRFDPEMWYIHWSAARIIVERWTGPGSGAVVLDAKRRFLVKTAFAYDVFAASTSFIDYNGIPASAVAFASSELFVRYLVAVQEATQAERLSFSRKSCNAHISIEHVRSVFGTARMASKTAVLDMEVEIQEDLSLLIDVFHYAGVLYGLQGLSDLAATEVARGQYIEDLAKCLSSIEDRRSLAHDLVWPLFIAGTEARERPWLQIRVRSLLPSIMQSTGYSNCQLALDFLERYWETKADFVPTWRTLARQEAHRGIIFLVI